MPRKLLDRRRAERKRDEATKEVTDAHGQPVGADRRTDETVLLYGCVALNCDLMVLDTRDNHAALNYTI